MKKTGIKQTDLQGYRKNFIKFLSGFMMVLPWITYLRISQYSKAEKAVFGGYDGLSIDFFIYHKELVLILVAVLALLWFVGERFLPQKVDNQVPLFKGKNKWLFVLIGIFVVGAVTSTLFSQYQKNALWGSPTVGEGLWTLLAYIVMILVFYNYFANDHGMSWLKKAVSTLSGITIVLSLVEWFYKPLLEIGFVQALVAPAEYADVVASMKASVFSNAISLTFYNPGYFGGFVCILLPFMVIYCLQATKAKEKFLYGILTVGLMFGVVASNATTALYVALLEVVLVLAMYIFSAGEKKEALVQGAVLCIVAFVAVLLSGVISGNSFLNIFSNANSVAENAPAERFEIEDIQLEANQIVLTGPEAELSIVYENGRFIFSDDSGVELSPIYDGSDIVFQEPGYEDLTVSIYSVSEDMEDVSLCVVVDAGYQSTIDFFLLKTGVFTGVGQGGTALADIGDAGTSEGLKQFYGLFTGRGYAWVNSLPILKETLLVGKGPGNFAFYFKQFDYAGLLTTHENVKQIIDKPHNAYLQYAINVGLPAAIAFFGIFVGSLVKAAKLFFAKGKQTLGNNAFHVAGIVAVLGFLVYSMINDSMVTVTPIVCMVTGALLASCYMMEDKK